ncbi:MAG: PorP/SprF family type IX secretion system membrane protein [Muribaculaceae bacterium]|nr:PorP/SprF family type IX secretion system membrane protein [Muribaculaceae bacterium]MDE7032331.1 PorP/SprF family type IX secretion system membrane protein [Muribaculaceae bacterium]
MTPRIIISLLLALAALAPATLGAQTDAQLSQYYEVPSFYNPAAVGRTDFIRIRGGARLQWMGIERAPKTFVAVADMPMKLFGKRIGLGVAIDQETAGLYSTLNASAQLAYKINKLGGTWTAGVQIGLLDQGFKGSEVDMPDDDDYHESNDDALPRTDVHGSTVDFSAGIWYDHRLFYAGISCSHLSAPTVKLNADSDNGSDATTGTEQYFEFGSKRTLYFIAGGNIQLKNTLFDILPSVLVKSDFAFTTAEINARVRYNKFLTFGVGYRWNDAVIATIAAEYKNFFIGYSYDYATTAIAKASSGSHEVFAGYSLKLNLGDKNRNKHKSIRYM